MGSRSVVSVVVLVDAAPTDDVIPGGGKTGGSHVELKGRNLWINNGGK